MKNKTKRKPRSGPIMLAIVAALTGRPRPAPRWRRAALGLGVAVVALVLVVALRGPAGISATVLDDGTVVGETTPGPIDVVGRDLPGGAIRLLGLEWDGTLRVPTSGAYRLWVEGRGRVRASVGKHLERHEAPGLRGEIEVRFQNVVNAHQHVT